MSQQINLFNPIFLKQKKYFSAVAMLQALALLIFGSLMVAAYATYQVSALTKEAALSAAQLQAAQAQLAKVRAEYAPRQKSQALEQQIVKFETDIQSYKQVFDILEKGDFGNTKGYSAYLAAFARQIVDGVWLTGLSLVGAGNEIEVRGRALRPEQIPAYINNLKREPVMQGKSFANLEMQVPDTKQPGKTDAASAKPKEPANYIEFSLR